MSIVAKLNLGNLLSWVMYQCFVYLVLILMKNLNEAMSNQPATSPQEFKDFPWC